MNENTNLNNLLSSKLHTWYFNSCEDDTSALCAPFRIAENAEIDEKYVNFILNAGSHLYEGQNFTLNFNLLTMINKTDSKVSKVSRKNECPKNITRIDYFNKDINPIKSNTTTISEESIQKLEKDYYLTFKNIFPNNFKHEQINIFFQKETKSIIVQLFHKKNIGKSASIIEKLKEEKYSLICEISKKIDSDELEIGFKKEKIPLQIFGRIFKCHW